MLVILVKETRRVFRLGFPTLRQDYIKVNNKFECDIYDFLFGTEKFWILKEWGADFKNLFYSWKKLIFYITDC